MNTNSKNSVKNSITMHTPPPTFGTTLSHNHPPLSPTTTCPPSHTPSPLDRVTHPTSETMPNIPPIVSLTTPPLTPNLLCPKKVKGKNANLGPHIIFIPLRPLRFHPPSKSFVARRPVAGLYQPPNLNPHFPPLHPPWTQKSCQAHDLIYLFHQLLKLALLGL